MQGPLGGRSGCCLSVPEQQPEAQELIISENLIEEAAKLSVQSGESLKQILEFVHMVNDQVQSIATASEPTSVSELI